MLGSGCGCVSASEGFRVLESGVDEFGLGSKGFLVMTKQKQSRTQPHAKNSRREDLECMGPLMNLEPLYLHVST